MFVPIISFGIVLIVLVSGRPQGPPAQGPQITHASVNGTPATIVHSEFENNGDGTFKWAVETSDGFKAEQSGVTVPPDPNRQSSGNGTSGDDDGAGESIRGSYSYNAPNGQRISVTYVADKNGFQPMGAHLPTSPPNPHDLKATSSSGSNSSITTTVVHG